MYTAIYLLRYVDDLSKEAVRMSSRSKEVSSSSFDVDGKSCHQRHKNGVIPQPRRQEKNTPLMVSDEA